ncbi:tetratricopeptide repeat protein [Sulfurimonas sp. SAG-AH-194-C21]|nr:tetratricopeptide repeat protein [Sulfurimonas sp. SAG-AH-194-C21]MDF1883626.1 tetratricopeptide repeat protein [Sulfurimonas sp. SAG-AH-194-C21]
MQSKTFRLFISSTFSDFKEERRVLQTEVFPDIKKYASKAGYAFQPIDLRWGVSNEVQLDQKTLELCLSEVKACKTHSHPNFLIMLGDRYGWVPLPYAIEEKEFKKIEKFVDTNNEEIKIIYNKYKVYSSADSKEYDEKQKEVRLTNSSELLKQWYYKDENQFPPSYVLKERDSKSDYSIYENWEAEENSLRTILQNTVENLTLSEEQKRKYFLSATEAEVEEGIIPYLNLTLFQRELLKKDSLLQEIDAQHIFGFSRNIDKDSQIGNTFIDESYEKAQDFKERVKDVLVEENTLHVEMQQLDENNLNPNNLETFKERMLEFLKRQIDTQKQEEEQSSYTPLEIELQAQNYFALQKRKNFLGQSAILERIEKYIEDDNTSDAFVLYGESGKGKSSILSQAINNAQETFQKRVLYRFVGATPNSSSSKEILISIFEELGVDIKSEDEKESFEDLSARVYSHLQNITEDVVIFIDAVDQLDNDDNFLWLPQTLPSNVKIVISALKDEKYKEDSKYFEALRSKTTTLDPISAFDEAEELLDTLLKAENRTIDPTQKAYFLKQYSKVESPLYVAMAAQEMKSWTSGDESQDLAETQRGIIEEFISNLTEFYHHDTAFVSKVLGYIYASRDGLSESELLTLLAQDEAFIQKMAPETWHENPNKELPLVHWSRLQTALKPFLNYKTQDNEELIYFFHREFEDVIRESSSQRDEHEAIIEATQKLIVKNQDKAFDANRWGNLYITLITEYTLRYEDTQDTQDKEEEFAEFLSDTQRLEEEWIAACIVIINSIGYDHSKHNRMTIAMAYQEIYFKTTKLLYAQNPDRWAEGYTKSLNNLASSYKSSNRVEEAIALEEESLEIRKSLYEQNPDRWAEGYTTSLNNLAASYYSSNRVEEAIALEEESLEILKSLYEQNPDRWAEDYTTSLNNLAISYHNKSNRKKVIELAIILKEVSEKQGMQVTQNYKNAMQLLEMYGDEGISLTSSNDKEATFTDLLYLSKLVALVNKEDIISQQSFEYALGFIEFNEAAKGIFSQIANLDEISTHEGAQEHIEKVRNMPVMQYDEQLLGLVSQLKEVFGDKSIGTLR